MNRLTEECKWVNHLTCDERAAATINGSLGGTNGWVSGEGFDELTMVVSFGAIASGVTPIDVELYENDTTSGAGTAITGAKIVQAAGGDEDDQIMTVNIPIGGRAAGARKKNFRATVTAGGSGNFDCNVHFILSKPKNEPVVNSPVSVQL